MTILNELGAERVPTWLATTTNPPLTADIIAKIVNNLILIFIVSLLVIVVIVVTIAVCIVRFYRQKNEIRESATGPRTRFRKRDKVLFYGRKMLRKVRSISAATGKKKKMISKLTKKFLQMKKDHLPTQLHVLEPAAEYLQEDVSNVPDQRLPPEVAYMLQSIRMFGVFERPLFLELCKHMQTLHLSAGQFLFRIGDADENFYVVQSGRLNVFITESDSSTVTLKVVKEGDSIASLLSFTDVLTGHPQPYKTVSAQALEESIVLKLPVAAFQEVFEQYPETFVRVIQIIMVRLHRVTFTALHQHLGLSSELVTAPRRKSVAFNSSPAKRGGGAHTNVGSYEENNRTPDLLDSDYTGQSQGNAGFSDGSQQPGVVRKRFTAPIMIGASMSAPVLRHGGGSSASLGQGMENTYPLSTTDEDMDEAMSTAIEAFRMNLGLEDDTLVKDIIHIRDIPAGAYLTKEDSHQDSGLVYNLSGLMAVTQRDGDREILMYHAYSGEFVGALNVLTGEPSVFTVRAKHYTRVAVMPTSAFYSIMSKKPKVVLHVAHIVVKRLSPFVRQIDFAMDWSFVESGRAMYRQGDDSDCTYIILTGRLRSVITRRDGKKQLVGEYSRGDLVGVVETLTCTPRSTTVMAVRDTEIAKLPEGLLNAIKLKYPIVVTRLINLLGHRILGSWQQSSSIASSSAAIENQPSHVNFCTVAVVAVTEDVPLSAFTYELIHSLSAIGTSLRLTSDYMKKVLGSSILESANEYKLNSWCAQQEDKHRIVLYQCDTAMTVWTQRCIRQADCILIVGMGDGEPEVGKAEKLLEHLAVRTQRELVLLHREGGDRPQNTAAWLNARSWCSSHHHLQCPKKMFTKKARHSDYYVKLIRTEPNVHSDFSRLARWLTGTSVGLVLGGGGARGAAHVGMIKSIQEAGIPIDMVGGVSIGAFMGALWCSERNVTTMTQKAREWSKKMTQWWRQILDLTYPATSMFSGAGFNQTIKETISDIQIEDLWLPYFTITTDITSSSMRIHTHGSLWRYVRSSMTIAGVFPPLCDPKDGHLLIDGCYVNNVPGLFFFV
ncbi:unnamed protein product [Allacma fusca]|uniref:Neuropathy target esterase sws n=1 Tax=Allacma fusca TaxID=39272 RepID=A0A8J2LSN7_9HEXA|nr:unnamed protein product [Allacma fusca]